MPVLNTMNDLPLPGCAPVPLASSLKALAVLRLLAEQADPHAAGSWTNEVFRLRSEVTPEQLVAFFLRDYQPSPIVAPWNGGSGFFPKDNREAIGSISDSKADRFSSFRRVIQAGREALAAVGKDDKAQLLELCRGTLPDEAIHWLDAAFVLSQDGPKYPPLLGTGGNDGRLEFSNNFMQRLVAVIDPQTGEATPDSERWLRAALFGGAARVEPVKAPIGQFFPGAAGGANNSSGFLGESLVNPWDYILMIEGALLFAAASLKKLEAAAPGQLVYPFCVRQAGVGYASAAAADEQNARCEMWLPLWTRPATLPELRALLGEGRAQVHGRAARDGVDFTRAVVTLGVERGISEFQRYGFQVRNGLAYFATPLERIAVQRNARADLLSDIDQWLDRFRGKAGGENASGSVARALRNLETSIVELCKEGSAARVQHVLIELGQCERALAQSLKWTSENFLAPVPPLSGQWLRAAETDTLEFRLAAALASLQGRYSGKWMPLRVHMEPVVFGRRKDRTWIGWETYPGSDLVWHSADLIDSLNAALARRFLHAREFGRGLSDTSKVPVCFADLADLIESDRADRRIEELLWGLNLIDWTAIADTDLPSALAPTDDDPPPSSLYALLKLCFTRPATGEASLPLDPAIHRHAARGDGETATRLAARRLRASGLPPAFDHVSLSGPLVRRTAAALIFPLRPRQVSQLRRAVIRRERHEQTSEAEASLQAVP